MRNPKRIKEILEEIEKIWMQSPDLRFGQLLITLGIANDDMRTWTIEDSDLILALKKYKEAK